MSIGKLPRDLDAQPVQVLSPSSPANVTVGASSNSIVVPSGWVVRLSSLVDCWVAFGDNTVAATSSDILVPAGTDVFRVPESATHIAVIQSTSAGILNVCKMD